MGFEVINGVNTLVLDPLATLFCAIIVLLIGYKIKSKVQFFERFCIPAPVVGGFTFMFLNWFFYMTNLFSISFDTSYQSPFMLLFFTTVGLSASLSLLKKGGKDLLIYWGLAVFITLSQCLIGAYGGMALGLDPVYGLVAGAPALVGGHGGATAYGTTIMDWGYDKGVIIGVAAATYGLIVGGLVGGPLGERLIRKYNLKPNKENMVSVAETNAKSENKTPFDFIQIMKYLFMVMFCVVFGTMLASLVSAGVSVMIGSSMVFPSYVGAMFLAILLRNINNGVNAIKFEADFDSFNEKFGDVFLGLFLSMALMTLKLWELAGLAGPLIILLLIQTVVIVSIAYFIAFRCLGKDYDAAIMCSGMVGHSLGATPTAIVNMNAVTEKFGMSTKAFLIVPIVGAFLVDFAYHPMMVWFLSQFK